MGSLIKVWKTIIMPAGATVKRDGTVTWTVRGKKRTGKLTPSGTVSIQSDTWTAQFTDENGKSQRISTKTTVRSVAEQMLAKYQTEVDRIRTGVATRDELSKAHLRLVTLEEARKLYQTKMVADGSTPAHITITLNRIIRLCKETGIDSVPEIRRETVVKWIANEVEKKVLALNTINDYLKSMKSFAQYLSEIELLPKNPIKSIKRLNAEVDQRKKRRAMTVEEIKRLLQQAAMDNSSKEWKTGERVLIYQLLLGTGLRSTELSLLIPDQIDFKRNRLRVEAAKTKNKKEDYLSMGIKNGYPM